MMQFYVCRMTLEDVPEKWMDAVKARLEGV
jgi:hypothetical protein|uniref:Uncharacterized protein n=1 Tax=Ackermannviridae sp. TaxID=2831612 RepID=A0A8S5VLB1_9CAUD|nr:MAG TPA: hypothetical protein [Ackermannviridae sp.]